MSIKAVVFDYGGVISFHPEPEKIESLAVKAGAEKEQFETMLWSLRGEYDRGKISARQYYRMVLNRLGVSMDEKNLDELIKMDYDNWKNINPGTVTLMEDVKKAGYTLGILSNMPLDFLVWARENVPVFSLPHVSVFSCDVSLIKPEKAIYQVLLSQAAVSGEELVFFDDRAENVRGAEECGIKAFIWKDPDNARRELTSLGVVL